MQVRKFEARTIKEAIELVKQHMGPDAIILSAKDNQKSFGLMGGTSVEVTAAVSETKLVKKHMAEKKLNGIGKQKYNMAKASTQKRFIDQAYESDQADIETERLRNEAHAAQAIVSRPAIIKKHEMTSDRYIDIADDEKMTDTSGGGAMTPYTPPPKAMVQANSMTIQNHDLNLDAQAASIKISSLQNEVQYLQKMLSQFQRVPQNFLNLHPGAEDNLPYELSFIFKKLMGAGMSRQNIVPILQLANEVLPDEHKKKKAFVDGWVIKYLLDRIQIVDRPFKSKLQVFVGPTGQGKTSSVVKMACHLLLNQKKRIAILSADHVKVGASDQIKIYSQILNVKCGIIRGQKDWVHLDALFDSVDYVLLDTPGVNLRGGQDLDLLRSILPIHHTDTEVHFVQSIMARDTDAFEIADRFRIIGFDDVIFTRLDEAVQHGMIYNFQKKFDVPIHSFGIGNVIPDDYELATKERIIDLIFNLTKIRKERGVQ